MDEPLQGVSLYALFLKIIREYSASRVSLSRYYFQQYSGNIYWLSMRLTLN